MADPTSEQQQKAHEIGQAGAEAAAAVPPDQAQQAAADAMKAKRDQVGFAEMTDQDIDRFAAALSPKLIEQFEQRGAFDAPPETPRAPEQAPPAPGEAAGAAAPSEQPPAPQKRTFAHRFMGVK